LGWLASFGCWENLGIINNHGWINADDACDLLLGFW